MSNGYNLVIVTKDAKIPYSKNPVGMWEIPKILADSHATIGFLGVYVEAVSEDIKPVPPVEPVLEGVPPVFDGTYETTEEQRNRSTKSHEVDLAKPSSGL